MPGVPLVHILMTKAMKEKKPGGKTPRIDDGEGLDDEHTESSLSDRMGMSQIDPRQSEDEISHHRSTHRSNAHCTAESL